MTIASFDTTIPLHIQKVFHWKTLQAGLLFLLLQLPSMIIVVPAGWVKDRIGMRLPVTIGFIILAPSLWLLRVPGESGFKWADGQAGQGIYIGALLAIGVCRTLMLGFGGVEVMRMSLLRGQRYSTDCCRGRHRPRHQISADYWRKWGLLARLFHVDYQL